jgi:hypothetical protein
MLREQLPGQRRSQTTRGGKTTTGSVSVETSNPARVLSLSVPPGEYAVEATHDLTSASVTLDSSGLELVTLAVQIDSDDARSQTYDIVFRGSPSSSMTRSVYLTTCGLVTSTGDPIRALLPLTSTPLWSGTGRLTVYFLGDL